MRTRRILSALMLSASALALACNDEMPPPVTPSPPSVAPITTVVIDAGAPVTAPAVTAAPVDAGTTAAADPPDAAAPSTSASGPDFFSCTTASDCVAIPKNDCCKNGFKEAVNKSSVDAYRASAPKCDLRRKCPMFRIMDKRTPDCSSGKCVLVQPSP